MSLLEQSKKKKPWTGRRGWVVLAVIATVSLVVLAFSLYQPSLRSVLVTPQAPESMAGMMADLPEAPDEESDVSLDAADLPGVVADSEQEVP